MKTIPFIFLLLILVVFNGKAQVSISSGGNPPSSSSMLDVQANNKGILIPRMSNAERNAISNPATGLLIYMTDDNTFYFYANSAWIPVLSGIKADNDWIISGNNMYSTVVGNVGINTTSPSQKLEVNGSIALPATTSSTTGVLFKGTAPFLHNYGTSAGGSVGQNTFLGFASGNFNMPGGGADLSSNNTGMGAFTLQNLTTGYANSAFGSTALLGNQDGYQNTAVGYNGLSLNTSGDRNSSIGVNALGKNSSGSNNVGMGYEANYYNQTGSNNTVIGYQAGYVGTYHNKSGSVFIGNQAGAFETASDRLYIENSSSTTPLIGGNFSTDEVWINGKLGLGASTLSQQLTMTGSVSLPATTSTSTGVIYKDGVSFMHNYKASLPGSIGQNTFLGTNAGNFTLYGSNDYLSSNNTGIGTSALHNLTTGYANVAMGSFCMATVGTGYENSAVGLQSMFLNSSGIRNSSLGGFSMYENTTGSNNVCIGYDANRMNQTGGNNTIVGFGAGRGSSVHEKSGNVFLGYNAGYNETGSNKLYIENSSSAQPLIGGDFSTNEIYINGRMGIGTSTPNAVALLDLTATNKGLLLPRLTTAQRTGISPIADGLTVYDTDADKLYVVCNNSWAAPLTPVSGWSVTGNAGLNSTTNFIGTTDNVALNFRVNNSPSGVIDPSRGNLSLGYMAMNSNTNGRACLAVGSKALYSNTTGYSNVALGNKALYLNTTTRDNVAIGDSALYSNGNGASGMEQGNSNTGVGNYCMYSNTTGYANTAVGMHALFNLTTGSYNTAVGSWAYLLNGYYNNTGVFGYGETADADNQFKIGNGAVSWIGGMVSWSTYSDGRFKRNVREEVPGLEFIMALRPVTYQWDIQAKNNNTIADPGLFASDFFREAIAEQEAIRYSGFIAQEVEQAANRCGYDFSGVQAPVSENALYSLRYAEFVVPLVKAVQEQQEEINMLEKANLELFQTVESIRQENANMAMRLESLERKLDITK